MSTYREAIFHARAGGTSSRAGKTIRFLTREEAEPILVETRPNRIIVKGKVKKIAPPNYRLQKLGLYDVSEGEPAPFSPTEEDIAATDWHREGVDDLPPPIVEERPPPEHF